MALMKSRKKVDNRTKSLRNTTFGRFKGQTLFVYNSSGRMTRKKTRKGYIPKEENLGIKVLCWALSRAFNMSTATVLRYT